MASVGAPAPARAGQDDPRLPQLFVALKAAQSPGWANAIEAEITHIWAESSDPETQQLMEKGLTAMAEDEDQAALKAFDAVVAHAPNFAEGWNKRATVEFLLDDYQASMADIAHTLQLEPRHFGALAGLGQVELALGDKAAALKAFSQALAIDPHLGDVADTVARLKKELEGKPV
ncbi:MAG TPA: tetratricopeptide repeat protein [Stellaceae bacterium]|nr:tetratricopeptide repeat protein [Stellaceae bacterium]